MNTEIENLNREIALIVDMRSRFRDELAANPTGLALNKEQTEDLLLAMIQLCDFVETAMRSVRDAKVSL